MACKFTELAIDCGDPAGLARFWCAVLGYEVCDRDGSDDVDDELVLIGSPRCPVEDNARDRCRRR